MDDRLKKACDLLISNRDAVKKSFFWDNDYCRYACAADMAAYGQNADAEQLKKIDKTIKEKFSAFSNFRGFVRLALVSRCTRQSDTEFYLSSVQSIYKRLNVGTLSGEYKALAAMSIADASKEYNYDLYAERLSEIYKRMKKEHMFLTDSTDIPSAALMALSDRNVDAMIEDMEACYNLLKKDLKKLNGTQGVCEILSLMEEPAEEKCARVKELYNALKNRKIKFSEITLPLLGSLASIKGMTAEEISQAVCETEEYLRAVKGFGNWGIGKELRYCFAVMLVTTAFAEDTSTAANLSTNTAIASSIATYTAIICCMVASSSAAAASAAASN